MKAFVVRQRGISLFGFLMLAVVVILVAILGMKVVPPYIHNAQIAQIFKAIAADSQMQNASVGDIRTSYLRRADVNYITDIKPEDIEISRDNGRLELSASYVIRVPLVANITLLLEFNPSSS